VFKKFVILSMSALLNPRGDLTKIKKFEEKNGMNGIYTKNELNRRPPFLLISCMLF
jgi:hypothetical protein